MARRKINAQRDEQTKRIESARNAPLFWKALDRFKTIRAQWLKYPFLDVEYRQIDWDANRKCHTYTGVYYDLRELCDTFDLRWPDDLSYLIRLAYSDEHGDDLSRPLDQYCPPQEQWRARRMADRTIGGLCRPTDEECTIVRELDNSGWPYSFMGIRWGFQRNEIAYVLRERDGGDIELKTISNWINNCRNYLINGGDVQLAAQRAGLGDGEDMYVLDWIAVNKTAEEK